MSTGTKRSLAGRVALVVGAGRPLGREIALSLARAGAAIAAHDLAPIHLDETCRAVQALGVRCQTYTADTGKGLSARSLLEDVVNDFKRLDILVHSLRIQPPGGLLDLDEWDWTRGLELNLSGAFLLLRAAASWLEESGCGTVVHVLAEPAEGKAQSSLLPAQQGLAGLTTWAAAELLTYNINCYAVEADETDLVEDAALVTRLCESRPGSLTGKVVRPGDLD